LKDTFTDRITDRQLEIIQAAGRILTSSGISGLTIKNLAKEMQFSESAIYRHFTSKEEIIIALLEYLAEAIKTNDSKILETSISPEEKFTLLFSNLILFFDKNPHFVVAVFSDGLLEESQRINETIMKIMTIKIKHLLPIILEGQKSRLFTSSVSAEDLIHIVIGAVRLMMFKWRVSNFDFDIKTKGEQMIKSLLTLIKYK